MYIRMREPQLDVGKLAKLASSKRKDNPGAGTTRQQKSEKAVPAVAEGASIDNSSKRNTKASSNSASNNNRKIDKGTSIEGTSNSNIAESHQRDCFREHFANDRSFDESNSKLVVRGKFHAESSSLVLASPFPETRIHSDSPSEERSAILADDMTVFLRSHAVRGRVADAFVALLSERAKMSTKKSSSASASDPKISSSLVQLDARVSRALTPAFESYQDVYMCCSTAAFSADRYNLPDIDRALMRAYCLHAVNHIARVRDTVLKNNARLREKSATSSGDVKDASDGDFAAAENVETDNSKARSSSDEDEAKIDRELASGKKRKHPKPSASRKKPKDQYPVERTNDSDDDEKDDENTADSTEYRDQGFTRPRVLIILPLKNQAFDVINNIISLSGASQIENKSRFISEFTLPPEEDNLDPSKPLDYQHDFRGNIDDMFRIGVKFTGRRHMKLFCDFYSADIIIASPLGLRMVVGAEGDKERDYDFLSSIEVVILDRSDIMLMQNWEHVEHIWNHLNLMPKAAHDCDFARVKSWYLDGRAGVVRQSIVISRFAEPEINALVSRRCKNVDGCIWVSEHSEGDGAIGDVVAQVPQMFTRLPVKSLRELDDARFDYFVQKTLPQLVRNPKRGTLLFIPSYFDYVRLPQRADFYPELVNQIESNTGREAVGKNAEQSAMNADGSVAVAFSAYDRMRGERCVGSDRWKRMTADGAKETFMFA
ncbi:rRNA-binding ribosome biosynthesis protein utp25 [Entophlyctis sp. JEL0112]|nr:rRNA-binding ribosome biosynthesis protein utp25 [Entophlyctis sp. JEL0112]